MRFLALPLEILLSRLAYLKITMSIRFLPRLLSLLTAPWAVHLLFYKSSVSLKFSPYHHEALA